MTAMTSKPSEFAQRLHERQAALRGRGLERTLQIRAASEDAIDLAGNDYLGMSTEPRVVEAAIDAARVWGTSGRASRLVSGTKQIHADLEATLADLFGTEKALVFSSGYLANLGAVTALSDPGTLLVVDAHAHASLIDAARLSRGDLVVVPHNDIASVSRELAERRQPRAMVLTESVFSVDGDVAPLRELRDACVSHDAVLLVDEAHAVGTLGDGRGLVWHLGMAGHPQVVVTATLSKALGSQGGLVAGLTEVCDFLVNRARTFVYDTALAPTSVAAALAAVQILQVEPNRVGRLRELVNAVARSLGSTQPAGAVLSIAVDSPERALHVVDEAASHGVWVGAFRPPSVPDDRSRIRVTVRSDLEDEQIARACSVLQQALSGTP